MTATKNAELLSRLAQLYPRLIDLSLNRMHRLLSALDDPQKALPDVIHVAGTNGKGSTIAYLRAILGAAGLKVHAYTSPHLRRFNERIVLASAKGGGRPISERALLSVLRRVEKANAGQPITQFEITTAAAFLAFAEHPADIVLLETGLGGRLDATNVVEKPVLSVITPISIDHTSFLGGTLEEIAAEKAGILKHDTPCVVAYQTDQALDVIKRQATKVGAPLITHGEHWDAYEQHGRLIFQDGRELVDLPLPRLIGHHQIGNAGTAVAVARALKKRRIAENHISRGLVSATWPARMELLPYGIFHELLPQGSEIWLDGGHNTAAGEVLSSALADLEDRVPRPMQIIAGMMSTKDSGGFLDQFKDLARFVATVDIPGQKNAYTAQELCSIACHKGFATEAAASIRQALELCAERATGPVRILITGSLYLAGHVLDLHERGFDA
ncbi:MAG: bifunctional folylpolyglutamate synthase/dihydrofolate synthase [Alphaproteobacteria bacterium]